MLRRYHEALRASPAVLRSAGASDGFVDIDSEFYVDPCLLERTRVPEPTGTAASFESYFRDVVRMNKHLRQESDVCWRNAVATWRWSTVVIIDAMPKASASRFSA